MIPKIIKTEAEHEAALGRIEKLMEAAPGSAVEAELELWGVLVEKYEDEHFLIPKPDPIAAIQFRMDQMGLTRADLLQFIPSKSKISEVFGRKRPLSLSMIRSLHAGLGIPAELLLAEWPQGLVPTRRPKSVGIDQVKKYPPRLAFSERRGT